MRINKTAVDRLPIPEQRQPGNTAQKRYYDDSLKGFGVRVTSGGVKSFFVERAVNGRLQRFTIGRYPSTTAEDARKQALIELGKMSRGIDLVAERRAVRAKSITLDEVFQDYLKARKSLKSGTVKDYERVMDEAFEDWKKKSLSRITKDMVARKHTELGKRSRARANNAMRVLRALFNFAAGEYEDEYGRSLFPENPVTRISHTKAWYRVDRRQTAIKAHELKEWYEAVVDLPAEKKGKPEVVRDYLLFLLFTGFRREEAARLTWDRVDLKGKIVTVFDTKNREPHTLPLPDYLVDLLKARKKETKRSKFVFPGSGKSGHLVEPRKQMEKVAKKSGVAFTLHDLRRTFITIAESLDIRAYALKRLLNHKIRADVTAGYIVVDVERLRKPMEAIASFILSSVEGDSEKKVVSFNR